MARMFFDWVQHWLPLARDVRINWMQVSETNLHHIHSCSPFFNVNAVVIHLSAYFCSLLASATTFSVSLQMCICCWGILYVLQHQTYSTPSDTHMYTHRKKVIVKRNRKHLSSLQTDAAKYLKCHLVPCKWITLSFFLSPLQFFYLILLFSSTSILRLIRKIKMMWWKENCSIGCKKKQRKKHGKKILNKVYFLLIN